MKQFFLILILAVTSIINCMAHGTDPAARVGPAINIRIEIGLPPMCSWKWAICDIDLTLEASGGSSQIFSGNGGTSWLISIPRETLLKEYPKAVERLDGRTTVTFESDFKASEELKKALGSYKDLLIQANSTYPLRYENGNYIITVRV